MILLIIYSAKKRISLEEKQQALASSLKLQDPHRRSMREFEDQDLKGNKSK